jgi:hypothetical protein
VYPFLAASSGLSALGRDGKFYTRNISGSKERARGWRKTDKWEVEPVFVCVGWRPSLEVFVSFEEVPNMSPVVCVTQPPTRIICEGLFGRGWDVERGPHRSQMKISP